MTSKLALAASLLLQILFVQMPSYAMDSSAPSIVSDPVEESRKKRLSVALTEILNIDVETSGDTLVFRGPLDKREAALAKLGDFDELRKEVVPVVANTIKTQAHHSKEFENWGDCLTCLGIDLETIQNFAINPKNDQDNVLKIPYIRNTADRQMAEIYLAEIKKQSPFFKWVSEQNKQLVTYSQDFLMISYGLLTEYFCPLDSQQEAIEECSSSQDIDAIATILPLNSVLQRLWAAAGGEISLVQTSVPGQFRIRTVMLGDRNNPRGERAIDIIIDKSSSMEGSPIATINRTMPTLLTQLAETMKGEESITLNIYAFNEGIERLSSYVLSPNRAIPNWRNIQASGRTDLTHVADRLRIAEGENKVVIAFTDGEHTESKDRLNDSYRNLRTLQASGTFAQPFLCRVAAGDKPLEYFQTIADIFQGSYSQQNDIDSFCSEVSKNIPEILVSKEPLVMTLNGLKVVVWQENAHPDIHMTDQTVHNRDTIMHRGVERVVGVLPIAHQETKEEKRQRLLRELEALDK